MSSILKALRKIGEEKRVDQHAAPDLRLDQGGASVTSKPFLPLLTGVILGAVIVGLIFFWTQRGAEPVAKSQPVSKPNQVVAIDRNPVDSASRVAVSPTNILPAQSFKDFVEASKVSVVTLSPEPVIVSESINQVAQKPISTSYAKQQKQVEINKPETTMQALSTPPVVEMSSTELSQLPEGVSLTVDEIFYQEDNANSMAVVNDLPVMIGSQIDSAVVTAILPDRVLFKIKDKSFSVAVTKP